MKVKDAIKALSTINPEDDIAILWYERDEFSDESDEDTTVTPEVWASAIARFEEEDSPDQYVTETIDQLIYEERD